MGLVNCTPQLLKKMNTSPGRYYKATFCIKPFSSVIYVCQFQIPSTLELMTLAQDDEQILEPDSSPLVVEHPSFPARTSVDWLKQHGLKGTSQ